MTETLAEGRYRVEHELGHGGMAVVYLARDEELHRPVAVKVLAQHLGGDETFRKRFLLEARLAARLSHPNIVQVYDAGETDGRPFIVMEYVQGRTLAECGQLPPNEAVALTLQACAGLQHAHDAGLVHRDVKPGNLLVGEGGVLKIADFGIARAAETTRLTQYGTILGTAEYLSPEQAAGDEVTAAADIYSLGTVLYELLTGRPPYQFESLAELAATRRSGVTPPRVVAPGVAPALETAVMHALAQEARSRPPSAADFAEELRRSLEPPTEALPPTAAVEPLRTRRFRSRAGLSGRLWLAGAAAVALVAVVLGLLQLGGGGSATPPKPVQIVPPTRGAAPADEARNLSAWLRAHSH